MRQVESNVAEALLRQDRYRYLAELTALTRNVPAVPREVYADADPASAVMLVEHYPHSDRPTVWLSACGATLVQEALDAVLGRLEEFALHSVDRSVFDALEATGQFSVAEVRCRRSFVCTAIGRVPPAQRRVAALTECDRDAFLAYPWAAPEAGRGGLTYSDGSWRRAGAKSWPSGTGAASWVTCRATPSSRMCGTWSTSTCGRRPGARV